MSRVVDESAAGYIWKARSYPRPRWRRLFVRTLAQADLTAPDGRAYTVRVVRMLWPKHTGRRFSVEWPGDAVTDVADLFANRVVWTVRVLEAHRSFFRPLAYSEEWRRLEDAIERARDIAQGLAEGRRQ
jgi:hypothetical protein